MASSSSWLSLLARNNFVEEQGTDHLWRPQHPRARPIPIPNDHRHLPKLDYSLAFRDEDGKRVFVTPEKQYDPNLNVFRELDWNQTLYKGEEAERLHWPILFEVRNQLEAECYQYFVDVPKARSVEIARSMERANPPDPNKVLRLCTRLRVEIETMTRRVNRQKEIAKVVKDAEFWQYDPSEAIMAIKEDPTFRDEHNISDYSDSD